MTSSSSSASTASSVAVVVTAVRDGRRRRRRVVAHQRFAVGDRDLVVVGVDFVEGEEPVAVAAVFDERGLQAGLNAGHLGEIDISAKLFAGLAFEIEFFNAGSVHDDHTRLFGVCCVDQHLLRHKRNLHGALRKLGPGADMKDRRARHRPSLRQCGCERSDAKGGRVRRSP
jgi:hypothetical protein